MNRRNKGRHFTLIIVAEGAKPKANVAVPNVKGAANILSELLKERIDIESRVTVLGHIQRGGSPVAFDRVLATRYGVHAIDLIEENRWGELVCLRDGEMMGLPLETIAGTTREVNPNHSLIHSAKAVGVIFGD